MSLEEFRPNFTEWEIFTRIASELPKIEQVFAAETFKLWYVFAPDYSEVFNYVVPLKITPSKNLDEKLRFFLATRSLMEFEGKKKILIPPYIRELNIHLDYIVSYGKDIETKELLDSIDFYLNDSDFQRRLSDLDESTGDADVIENIINLAKIHEKKLAHIFDLLSRLGSSITKIGDLSNSTVIERASKYIKVDAREALENSDQWFEKLELLRRNDKGTSHSSLMDAWAIEYIKMSNQAALSDNIKNPLVIYITRSKFVQQVVSEALRFYLPDNKISIDCLWTPDTFLAYSLFYNMPNRTPHATEEAIKELKILQKSYTSFNPEIRSTLNKFWNDPNILSEGIENISSLYNELNRMPQNLSDLKNNPQYSSNEVLASISTIVDKIKENPESIRAKLNANLKILWEELRRVDNFVDGLRDVINYESNLPMFCIEYLNKKTYCFLKLLRHSILINIPDIESAKLSTFRIITSQNVDEFRKNFINQEVVWLVDLLFEVFNNNLDHVREEILLKQTTLRNKSVVQEAKILKLSLDYMEDQKLDINSLKETISYCDGLLLHDYKEDPRIYKLISLFSRKLWEVQKDIQVLRSAHINAENAIRLVNDDFNDFKFECLNNKIYFELLLFDEHDITVSVDDLVSALKEMEDNIKILYGNGKPMPPEFYHTIGKLEFLIAENKKEFIEDKYIKLISSARENIAVALSADLSNISYRRDYRMVKETLSKIHKKL